MNLTQLTGLWPPFGASTEPVGEYTLDGPDSGTLGVRSCAFTIELGDGLISGTIRFTFSDNGAGGSFSPTFLDLDDETRSGRFTYVPATTGDVTISVTNDGGLADPAPLALTVTRASRSDNMMRWGLDYLTRAKKAHESEPITYRRRNKTVSLRATLGEKLLKLDDGEGNWRMEWTDMDFLIPADDLVIDGILAIPQEGDRITVSIGCESQTYRVEPFEGDPAWRWSDPVGRTMFRVHTKRFKTEPT